jgi:inner membrane protein
MPTPVAHSIAGAAIYLAGTRTRAFEPKLLLASAAAACLADIDFAIGVLIGRNIHHYFTHSLGFTALFAVAVFLASRWLGRPRPARDAAVLGLCYLSHVLLDMLSKDTRAPYGVELFWPFSGEFYISPVLVFDDIWRGTLAKLLGLHNWLAVLREVLLVGPPAALVLYWRRRTQPE